MKLFVGLGNPGAKYAGHRHNVGYMVVDRIAVDHGFGGWRSKFQGQISDGRLASHKIMLLKPETFMNDSGRAVSEAQRFHRLAPEDVVVFHDEIDLAPGKMRVKHGGSHAGHNGLRSIDAHIGNNYQRVRIGVGHPGRRDAVHSHVLRNFSKSDQAWLEDLLAGISDGAPFLAKGDIDKFRNATTRRAARQAKKPDAAPRQRNAMKVRTTNVKGGQDADMTMKEPNPPGWDAQAISKIAKEEFGGFKEMFECHGWPERGSAMMPQAGKRVADRYGTVQNFVEHYTQPERQGSRIPKAE